MTDNTGDESLPFDVEAFLATSGVARRLVKFAAATTIYA